MPLNLEELQAFRERASKFGWANEAVKSAEQPDHSATIEYAEGDWSVNDNYFGGEPYGGREVIFYKGQPVWTQLYYGYVTERNLFHDAYQFLKTALSQPAEKALIRGPEHFSDGEWDYSFLVSGDMACYDGEEIIKHKGKKVYWARIVGGLVDVKDTDE